MYCFVMVLRSQDIICYYTSLLHVFIIHDHVPVLIKVLLNNNNIIIKVLRTEM